jgi:GntP family gluconate:H+ symporter
MIILIHLSLSVLSVIILNSKLKLNPILSLFIGSIILGILLEMTISEIFNHQVTGFFLSIKNIGLIIFFSCVIGQYLKETRSIEKFGNLLLNNFQKQTLLSINMLGLFIGTVVFCDSAFLILNGISRSIASSSSISLTSLNLSLSGGLYSSHTLIPPTPGPIAAINNFNVIDNIGTIMILGILVSIPSSLIAFLFSRSFIKKNKIKIKKNLNSKDNASLMAYLSIVIPLLLISLNTISNLFDNINDTTIYRSIKFIGNPNFALFVGMILSFFIPYKKIKVNKIFISTIKDFLPIILLTSMGAAFGNIIKNSNISEVIPNFINIQESNIIYLCAMSYILSFILKTSQGSSTSSMIIVSSIIFPIISDINFNIFDISMIILSIGAGSMMISHVNDSYFWIVTKQTSLNLKKGLKYFSVMTILQSTGTLLFIFMLLTIFS